MNTHDIERYAVSGDIAYPIHDDPEGDYVTYEDHVAAIEADRNERGGCENHTSRQARGDTSVSTNSGEPVGTLSRSADESIKFTPFVDLHVTDGMLVYTAPQPSLEGVCQNHPQQIPECPFPCGWQGLHKIVVKDAAWLAKADWPEDEEGVSVLRGRVIRNMDYLIQVCRAMLEAAPEPKVPHELPDL